MDDLVERARAALDGTTPGPWVVESDGWISSENEPVCMIEEGGISGVFKHAAKDARFIAAARSLVPEMADRIAALEAENARAVLKALRDEGVFKAEWERSMNDYLVIWRADEDDFYHSRVNIGNEDPKNLDNNDWVINAAITEGYSNEDAHALSVRGFELICVCAYPEATYET